MKKIVLAMALIPAVGFASAKQQPFVITDPTVGAPVQKSYVCKKYTDNEISLTQGYLTDNPIVEMETTIEQTKYEFIVEKNDLFKDEIRMSIPEGGGISGVAGNQHDMLFRRVDGNGKPFFIVYFANTDPQSDGGINRAVYIADCTRN